MLVYRARLQHLPQQVQQLCKLQPNALDNDAAHALALALALALSSLRPKLTNLLFRSPSLSIPCALVELSTATYIVFDSLE